MLALVPPGITELLTEDEWSTNFACSECRAVREFRDLPHWNGHVRSMLDARDLPVPSRYLGPFYILSNAIQFAFRSSKFVRLVPLDEHAQATLTTRLMERSNPDRF